MRVWEDEMNQHSLNEDRGFDWSVVRQRISKADVALEASAEISREEMEEIWARRAEELAALPVEEDERGHIRLVMVRLGCEIYGIEAHHVFNVRTADQITAVPRTPAWVAGVINLRGRIFSVVDLRRYFNLPEGERADCDSFETGEAMPRIIVVETPDMEIALLVDEVLTVEALPMGDLQDATGTVRGLHPEYVQGVIARPVVGDDQPQSNSMLVVLDLVTLLADERLIIHEEIV